MPGPYWKLLLCYGAIPGLCFGIGMVVALASVSEYFDKRQNLAIQLVLLSTSAGAFAANPTCGAFIQHYSWRGALLIISAIFLHLLPAGATMRPVHHLQIKRETGSHFKSTSSPGTYTRMFQTAARYFDLRIFSMSTFYLSMLYISFHCIGL
uniref:Major facilitator superfamily (MFS) profile domain-containing protein n=1 Tax=Ciona savignyi TaxID=51511 RepID=H2ZH68_CIOSA